MMINKEKSRLRLNIKRILISLATILIIVVIGTGVLFYGELKIINSIKKLADDKPIYYMEIDGDYHFEEFLKLGGASSDKEVSAFLTKCISKGFYTVDVKESGPACSTISAMSPEGSHVWGRNFDWTDSVPIIVKCVPKDGYSSISTCEFKNITSRPDAVPESIANKMLAIASLYVPMDGINEAGLCIADLEVNEGGMITNDTDKSNLTITTAIRLILNKAATVEEAIELLKIYDIFASGGISHHLAISDATGASVAVEFVDGELIVVNTNSLTNFNIAKGNTAAGGENSKQRFEQLISTYKENKGILTSDQVKKVLAQVSQSEGNWITQWSIMYDHKFKTVNYYFNCDFEKVYSFLVGK